MTQYAALDAALKARIAADAGRAVSFAAIFTGEVRCEAQRLAEATGRMDRRIVDGRLQALRRAGKLVFTKDMPAGWRLSASN